MSRARSPWGPSMKSRPSRACGCGPWPWRGRTKSLAGPPNQRSPMWAFTIWSCERRELGVSGQHRHALGIEAIGLEALAEAKDAFAVGLDDDEAQLALPGQFEHEVAGAGAPGNGVASAHARGGQNVGGAPGPGRWRL